MFRACLLPALAIAALVLSPAAQASDTCARATPGKCRVGQPVSPKKGPPGAVTNKAAQPPARGNHKGRNQYTAAERDKIMESARALCRKVYGAPATVYRFDYKRNEVWCVPPAY